MATILPFQRSTAVRSTASISNADEATTCRLYLFTGVRYERGEPEFTAMLPRDVERWEHGELCMSERVGEATSAL
jgi:hypothetical protein